MSDIAAEIDQVVEHGKPVGWRFALFLDGNMVAEGVGQDVHEAAKWCAHRLRRNAERGLSALNAMGLMPVEPT